jgi:SAM-dependent methyltransferase/predicted transcriptional regulator
MERDDGYMQDARGFMKSRLILTAAELDLFTRCDDHPTSAQELVRDLKLDLRAATRLLDALVTIGMLEKEGGKYRTTEHGSPFSSRHPQTVLPMVLHMCHLWNTWGHLTDIVRSGKNPNSAPGVPMSETDRKAFIGAMHVAGRKLSQEVADAYDLSGFQRLLDIGGGSGTYTIAFLKNNPRLKAVLFDLESVIPMAQQRLRDEGFLDRVALAAGDFYKDELPKGCDLALLSAIIHQSGPEENLQLYQKIHRALDPGGTILIRDHIMDESRTIPPMGAMFAINMLVNTRNGDTYTFEEIKDALEKAGFEGVRLARAGQGMDGLVEARKPR